MPAREGGSHSIWSNPHTGRKESIPRHNEIKKHLARSICRNLSVPVPPGD
jgi:predicted RNA binding protein YcfA (HicA-like mRNA interferase family)